MFKLNKKGQNTAEYAVVLGLVVAAAMAMQVYVSRSLQSGVKLAANKIVTEDNQYEPYYLQSQNTSTQQGHTETENMAADGTVTIDRGTAITSREGVEAVLDHNAQPATE
jgi:hypothetical protein